MANKIQIHHDLNTEPLWNFKDYMFGTTKNTYIKVLGKPYKKFRRTYIELTSGISTGDIIMFKGVVSKFYIKRWVGYSNIDNSLYEIKRLDKNRISQFDLDSLTVNLKGTIRGYVNKPTK